MLPGCPWLKTTLFVCGRIGVFDRTVIEGWHVLYLLDEGDIGIHEGVAEWDFKRAISLLEGVTKVWWHADNNSRSH